MNLQEKAETRVPEFRLDQRGKDREQSLKSLQEGLGSSPAPGQSRVQIPGRPGKLCV